MPTESARTEAERFLRAAVRAALSPGIWLMVLAQLLAPLLLRTILVQTGGGGANVPTRLLLATLVILGMIYLLAGAYTALAHSRDILGVASVMGAGRAVFFPALGLVVRALLLSLAFVMLLLSAAVASGAQTPEEVMKLLTLPATLIGLLLPFLLVYWFPYVFARRDFRVLATMAAAVKLLVRYREAAVMLALLVLAPSAMMVLLPANAPMPLRWLAAIVSLYAVWVANVYCAERASEAPGATQP